jgi:integrase
MAGVRGEVPNLTVHALLERYKQKVSAGKKGKRWETVRLTALQRDDRLALVRLRSLDTPHVADWQERRLEAVSSPSVRRERNLLNHVFEVAVNEWHWLKNNPFGPKGKSVRRPKDGKSRKRTATPAETAKLDKMASSSMRRAITIALETGMRASEIASNPQIKGSVAHLADSKNDESREVPLSDKAVEAWLEPIDLTAGSISGLFARLCDDAEIEGLTFHDLRHTAATRLSKKLDLFQLCKMFGWKDPRHALIYYNESADDIAKKL